MSEKKVSTVHDGDYVGGSCQDPPLPARFDTIFGFDDTWATHSRHTTDSQHLHIIWYLCHALKYCASPPHSALTFTHSRCPKKKNTKSPFARVQRSPAGTTSQYCTYQSGASLAIPTQKAGKPRLLGALDQNRKHTEFDSYILMFFLLAILLS